MKIIFWFIGLFMIGCCSHAQQKKKQIQYLLDQIAANKVYIDYLEKGYKVAHEGLQTIEDIKKGDLHLHLDHFTALQHVNPILKNWAKAADIIMYQLQIIKGAKQTIQDAKAAGRFTDEELDYCKSVFDNLLNECLKSIDELATIITDNKVTMNDDDRIRQIDKLYDDMQEKYSFAASFSRNMGLLSTQRLSEQVEADLSKKVNSKTSNP